MVMVTTGASLLISCLSAFLVVNSKKLSVTKIIKESVESAWFYQSKKSQARFLSAVKLSTVEWLNKKGGTKSF